MTQTPTKPLPPTARLGRAGPAGNPRPARSRQPPQCTRSPLLPKPFPHDCLASPIGAPRPRFSPRIFRVRFRPTRPCPPRRPPLSGPLPVNRQKNERAPLVAHLAPLVASDGPLELPEAAHALALPSAPGCLAGRPPPRRVSRQPATPTGCRARRLQLPIASEFHAWRRRQQQQQPALLSTRRPSPCPAL